MDFSLPKQLGNYRLLRRIGRGGMAEVFEAQKCIGAGATKRVALKVLLPDLQQEPGMIDSFVNEAKIAASLSHPNLVMVLDLGCVQDMYFIAMELIEGFVLSDIIHFCNQIGRAIPVPLAAFITNELATALQYLHSHELEIVHRDVTPQNIFVGLEGVVKLGDFGVAKCRTQQFQTERGTIKGKLPYLSPEQVTGDPITSRSDIYALGLVLFELLTLERYNSADYEAQLLVRAMNPVYVPPSKIRHDAAPLDAIVRGALQKHQAMRTRDASVMAEQLQHFIDHAPCCATDLAEFISAIKEKNGKGLPLLGTSNGQNSKKPISRDALSGSIANSNPSPQTVINGTPSVQTAAERRPMTMLDNKNAPAQGVMAISAPREIQPTASKSTVSLKPSRQENNRAVVLKPTFFKRTQQKILMGAIGIFALGLALLASYWPEKKPTDLDLLPQKPFTPSNKSKSRQTTFSHNINKKNWVVSRKRPHTPAAERRDPHRDKVEVVSLVQRAKNRKHMPAAKTGRTRVSPRFHSTNLKTRKTRFPLKNSKKTQAKPRFATKSKKKNPLSKRANPPLAPPKQPNPSHNKPTVPRHPSASRQTLRKILILSKQKGLFPGDDPVFDRHLMHLKDSILKRRNTRQTYQQTMQYLDTFRITKLFIQRKLKRFETTLKRSSISDPLHKKMDRMTRQILQLILDDQLIEASQIISRALAILREP